LCDRHHQPRNHPEEIVKKLVVTLFVVLLAIAVSTPTLSAQDNMSQGTMGSSGGQPNKAEVMAKLEKISTALQLSPAQKQQMLPILKEEAPKIQAIKSNTSLGPLQKGMQLRQIGEATDAKVQPILSPEQWQKWQAMRAQEKEQMMQKMENKQ
jgi:hypothetical protein